MAQRLVKKLMKSTWYPQPHFNRGSCSFELDDETINSTIVPFAFYDEGKGTPTAQETNPRNAAFGLIFNECNCFVNSRVNSIFAEFRFSLTAQALDDNIPAIRFAYMPIHTAFIEDYTSIDELTSEEVQDVLEMTTESTDRQGGPLYVAAKEVATKFANSAIQGTNTPFLDTTVDLEAIAFDSDAYYNAIHFHTNAGKISSASGGLRWDVLTQNKPFIRKRFHIVPKVKRMNEFTYFGLMLHIPIAGTRDQLPALTEITVAKQMLHVDWSVRYNEWNEDFNSRML